MVSLKGSDDLLAEEIILTANEVASFLKVSVSAVRRWTREGNLKGHRLGGKGDWRYVKKDVINFLYGEQ
ncbi:MAG: helix-turn-helix domain-containing protein [Dehalococcoidales bacterium]|jgi:excisionase family DNA binding protein|nr:helix-turn-helix domain-containing protein [Dehalococcoidales bacterium]